MASRRGFLTGLLAAGAAPALSWADAGGPAFLACAREADGAFALFGLTRGGAETFRVPLPARGHAGAGHPVRPIAVAFARRPGTFALVIDCVTGAVLEQIAPPEGRQFNGHGMFLDGGRLLVTSEQVAETSAGRLGLWDAHGWRRIGEVGTGGIGPHDVRLLADGETLVVANGGIATDPEDRTKLNIATMRPGLAYLTLRDGVSEVAELPPELHRASIRHLALMPDGRVAFAMQWEGPEEETPPLLGLHRPGAATVLGNLPEAERLAMAGYAGSIACAGGGDGALAISSPRSGRVQVFGADGRFRDAVSRPDVCGLAPLPGGFLMSDGLGGLIALEGARAHPLARRPVAWDNHIVAL